MENFLHQPKIDFTKMFVFDPTNTNTEPIVCICKDLDYLTKKVKKISTLLKKHLKKPAKQRSKH